jgi:hypothetical protein
MKIPKTENVVNVKQGTFGGTTIHAFHNAALEMTVEYGVYVKVVAKWDGNVSDHQKEFVPINEIVFEVMGHQFDSLRDLRKALENKTFL